MSFYRIYRYPLKSDGFKHIYFKRDRSCGGERRQLQVVKPEGERFANNLARAKRTVRDLILCNQFDYFCTFTFNAEKVDRYNYGECSKKLRRVFNNYKNRYSSDFKYLIIPEFHKDGAVHFHGVVRGIRTEDLTVPEYVWRRNLKTKELEQVPNTKKYVDWKYYSDKLGFFNCSAIKNYEACARYVTKYITKDLGGLSKGQRLFMSSAGLKRPELVFDMDDIPCVFTPQYQDDFVSMTYSDSGLDVLPSWYGECCSELSDPVPEVKGEVVFSPETGIQLKI